MRFKAALFDMDGVLVDSGPAHLKSWQDLAREQTLVTPTPPFTAELFQRTFGKHGYEILREWLGFSPEREVADALLSQKEAAYRNVAPQTVLPVAGVVNWIRELHTVGLRIGVASSGPRENVEMAISLLGIAPFLTGFTNGNEVREAKPAPDVFLLAAKKADVSPADCVVFEDSLSGVAAGRAAGMTVVSVSTTRPAEELLAVGARLVWTDFREASVGALNSL